MIYFQGGTDSPIYGLVGAIPLKAQPTKGSEYTNPDHYTLWICRSYYPIKIPETPKHKTIRP